MFYRRVGVRRVMDLLALTAVFNSLYGGAEDMKNLPTFDLTTSTNVTVVEGESARLPCIIANLNDRHVSWQRRGAAFPLTVASNSFFSSRFLVEAVGNFQWNLIVKWARLEDAGVYQCKVTTRTMLLVREVRLNVVGDSSFTSGRADIETSKGEPEQMSVDEGRQLLLSCNGTDVTLTQDNAVIQRSVIEWFKDGEKVDSSADNGIVITTYIQNNVAESTLTVDSLQLADTGLYVCSSTDKTYAKFKVELTDYNSMMSQDQPVEDQADEASAPTPANQLRAGGDNSAVTARGCLSCALVMWAALACLGFS